MGLLDYLRTSGQQLARLPQELPAVLGGIGQGVVAGLASELRRGTDAGGTAVAGMAGPWMALMRGDDLDQPLLPTPESGGRSRLGAVASAMNPNLLPGNVPGSLGSFGGRLSPMANQAALAKAEQMEQAGKSAAEIRKATNWERGFDGGWRWEIDDSAAQIKRRKDGTEFLHHPRLRNAYPDIFKDLKVERVEFAGPKQKAEYDTATNTIRISKHLDANEALDAAMHEITHPIQDFEGFSPGSAPWNADVRAVTREQVEAMEAEALPIIDQYRARYDAYRDANPGLDKVGAHLGMRREMDNALDPLLPAYDKAIEKFNQINNQRWLDDRVFQNYNRSMGEYEAREVARRRRMTMAERRADPPYSEGLLDPKDLIDLRQYQQANPIGPPDPKAMVGPGQGMLFDYSRLGEVPDVPQRGLERYIPPRGVSERAQMLDNPRTIRRVEKYLDRGLNEGGAEWYNTEPLREAFLAELGDKAGQKAFEQYIQLVSATSPQSRIPENIRNASYYYSLLRRGLPLPTEPPLPSPYGHKAQKQHIANVQTVAGPGWDVLKNPKPPSFAENLLGNQRPVTVDTHNVRAWGRLSGDEAWVAGRAADNPSRHPRELLAKGFTLDDLQPTDFTSQPAPNEYGFLEQLQQRRAQKKGISPAQYQSALWLGAGEVTGLGSPPEPFLRTVERRIRLTAERRGEPPEKVLKDFIRGEQPLFSAGPVPGLLPVPAEGEDAQAGARAVDLLPGGLLGTVKARTAKPPPRIETFRDRA